MSVEVPSPAVAIIGRHNSGKTTLIVKLIATLVERGFDAGSVKHHSHAGFQIDHEGKDSYRHREAGASETVIAAPGQVARVKTVKGELECDEILRSMPGHDVVIVEGYRKSGLPSIEVMRAGNDADAQVARVFYEGALRGLPLGADFTQLSRAGALDDLVGELEAAGSKCAAETSRDLATDASRDLRDGKLPQSSTEAVVTDIPEAIEAAQIYGIPAFDINDVTALADFIEQRYVRPRVSVVIQAGGESKRMGRSKATVPFAGKPLICRLIGRLAPVADELLITTNEPENLGFLSSEFPDLEIRLVRDVMDYRGALPGLYTALSAARNPYVAAVACDMVNASAALVVVEALRMSRSGADVVVPANKHGYEPFHAMYRREACLPAVRAAIERGDQRVQAFFGDVNVYKMPHSEVFEAEPRGGCFINVNTPQDLAMVESYVLGNGEGRAGGRGDGGGGADNDGDGDGRGNGDGAGEHDAASLSRGATTVVSLSHDPASPSKE